MAEKVTHRINNVIKYYELLDKGVTVLCACNKDQYRKPHTGMFVLFENYFNHGIKVDRKNSFFVGDADGSYMSFGDSDKAFAEALNLPFKSPGEYFEN